MTSITLASCPSPHTPKNLPKQPQSPSSTAQFPESKFPSFTLGNWKEKEDQQDKQAPNDGTSQSPPTQIKLKNQNSPVSSPSAVTNSSDAADPSNTIPQEKPSLTSDTNGVLFQNLADFNELSLNPNTKSEGSPLLGLDVGRRFELGAPIDPYGNVGSVPAHFTESYVVKHNERRRYSQTPKRKSQSLYEKSTSSADVYGKGYSRASFSEARDIRASHQFFQDVSNNATWSKGGDFGPLFDGSVKSSSSETLRTSGSRYKHLSIDTTITDFDTIPFPVDLGELGSLNTEGLGCVDPKGEMYGGNYYPQRKKRASVIETKTDMNICSEYSFGEPESGLHQGAMRIKDRKARPSTSIYRGVSRCGKDQKYQARLRVKGKVMYLGRFKDEIEAAKCYDRHAKRHLGSDAKLNFPETTVSE